MSKERLFCEDCGEEQEFNKEWLETMSFTVGVDCDGNHTEQPETTDCGKEEEDVHFECGNCGSEVEFFSELAILECKVEHVDKDGEWQNYLDEEDRNPDLVRELTTKSV